MAKSRLAVLAILLVLSACAWYETMQSRSTPDTRIRLQPGQRMEFGLITKRNKQGQHIEEYRCGDAEIMVCRSHGITLECQCFRR